MDSELKKYLIILGFKEEDMKEVPKRKTILMFWRREARRCPHDKGGVKEDFQKLQDALKKVDDIIDGMNIDNDDEEEVLARKIFKEFNSEKENSNSFTILIENVRVHDWNSIFVKIYGEPRIPNDNESNGRHWDHQNYNIDGVEQKISITMWMNPKNKQSKLLIQSSKQIMTMMWVTNELPNIFMDVMKVEKKKIESDNAEISKESLSDSTAAIKFNCDRCQFSTESNVELKNHMEIKHIECGKCSFATTVAIDLNTHHQSKHSKKQIQHCCQKCEFSSGTKKSLAKHVENEHTSKQKCPKCNEPRGGKQIFECKSCPTVTHVTCLSFLGRDRVAVYKSKKELFECDGCVKKRNNILVESANEEEPVITLNEETDCDKCEFRTEDTEMFNEHVKTHALKCDECDKMFDEQIILDQHKEKDHGDDTSEENVEKGLLESCKHLQEKVLIERNINEKNVSKIENMEKRIKSLELDVEKANDRTKEVRDNLMKMTKESIKAKDMLNSEIINNERKQSDIEKLQDTIKKKDEEILRNNGDAQKE